MVMSCSETDLLDAGVYTSDLAIFRSTFSNNYDADISVWFWLAIIAIILHGKRRKR